MDGLEDVGRMRIEKQNWDQEEDDVDSVQHFEFYGRIYSQFLHWDYLQYIICQLGTISWPAEVQRLVEQCLLEKAGRA